MPCSPRALLSGPKNKPGPSFELGVGLLRQVDRAQLQCFEPDGSFLSEAMSGIWDDAERLVSAWEMDVSASSSKANIIR